MLSICIQSRNCMCFTGTNTFPIIELPLLYFGQFGNCIYNSPSSWNIQFPLLLKVSVCLWQKLLSSLHCKYLQLLRAQVTIMSNCPSVFLFHIANRYEGFTESEIGAVLEQLLKAIDEQDGDQTVEVLSLPLFKYLDNDVSMCWMLCN